MKRITLLLLLFLIYPGLISAQRNIEKVTTQHPSRSVGEINLSKSPSEKSIITPNFKGLVNKSDNGVLFYENWDGYDDFATDLSPWITIQQSAGPTWASNGFDFPGEGEQWAFMAFNPYQTNPPIAGNYPPVDGDKYAIAIQYQGENDNKWLISPQISIPANGSDIALLFYAKSLTAEYGLERFRVLVSTSGTNPADFTPISPGPYVEAPDSWEQFYYDLSLFTGQNIHIAIQYVSEDAFIFMFDAFTVLELPDFDNRIASVEYKFYQWWPSRVGKEIAFLVSVKGMGIDVLEGDVSFFVDDVFIGSIDLEPMLFGMEEDVVFFWTPDSPGEKKIKFQLSDDDNLGNNSVEFTVNILDKYRVVFSDGFEHVNWDVDPPLAIFPPPGWLTTEWWSANVSRSLEDLISAAVFQVLGEPEELLVSRPFNLYPGKFEISFITAGMNNAITLEGGDYLGHATLNVYLLDQSPSISTNSKLLLHTESFENGDGRRVIRKEFEIAEQNNYYIMLETTSTFNFEDYASGVFIDNIIILNKSQYTVDFNIDMTGVNGFDPEQHKVFLTGDFNDWAVPGSEASYEMSLDESIGDKVIFSVIIDGIQAGAIYYNYYSDAFGVGWEGNDFDTEVIRSIGIYKNELEVNDVWGVDFTSVPEVIANDDHLNIYPNPVRNILYVSNSALIEQVRVYDITGRMVLSERMDDFQGQIDISNLHNGLYILQVMTGGKLANRKFAIKN